MDQWAISGSPLARPTTNLAGSFDSTSRCLNSSLFGSDKRRGESGDVVWRELARQNLDGEKAERSQGNLLGLGL